MLNYIRMNGEWQPVGDVLALPDSFSYRGRGYCTWVGSQERDRGLRAGGVIQALLLSFIQAFELRGRQGRKQCQQGHPGKGNVGPRQHQKVHRGQQGVGRFPFRNLEKRIKTDDKPEFSLHGCPKRSDRVDGIGCSRRVGFHVGNRKVRQIRDGALHHAQSMVRRGQ